MNEPAPLSPQRQPEDQDAALRPRPGFALVALLAAPLAAAIVSILGFAIGAWAWEYQPESVSSQDLGSTYVAFAVVFIPLGGLLTLMFWRKAPFTLVPSTTAGTILGTLVGCLAVLILQLPGENYPSVSATVALGAVSGIAGGLTFWLICCLSKQKGR